MENNISKAGQPNQIVLRKGAIDKPAPINGKALVAVQVLRRKSDLRLLRRKTAWRAISETAYFDLAQLGRAKYRGIVVSTFMALLWDGWTARKKTKRKPSSDVMVTRRMLAAHFGFSESTAKQALADLTKHGLITVSRKSVYSGKKGNNLGTFYRLPWMEKKPSGKHLKIYWGLLVSDAFLALSVTPQAIIILLHALHNRSKNRLTIHPSALSHYGIHRTTLPAYVNELMAAGFLIYLEEYDYAFGWIGSDGKPDFDRLNKNFRVANSPRPCSQLTPRERSNGSTNV